MEQKMYYLATHFIRPKCRNMESTLKAVVLADSKAGAYSKYYKRFQSWIEGYRDYRDFSITIWEQEDDVFSFN